MQDRNKYADMKSGRTCAGTWEGKEKVGQESAAYVPPLCVKQRVVGKLLPYSTGAHTGWPSCRAGMGRRGWEGGSGRGYM